MAFDFSGRGKTFRVSSTFADRQTMLETLTGKGILLNDYARRLLETEHFEGRRQRRSISIAACSLNEIGLAGGGNFAQIEKTIKGLGLCPCPVEFAPSIRLLYREPPSLIIRAGGESPEGAVTIFSPPAFSDPDSPRGFYMQYYEGSFWLRGYRCSDDYCWKAEDRMIFMVKQPLMNS